MLNLDPHRSQNDTTFPPDLIEPVELPLVAEPQAQGSVSLWLNYKGDRLWSIRVPVGAGPAAVDAAITIALAAEGRLERGAA